MHYRKRGLCLLVLAGPSEILSGGSVHLPAKNGPVQCKVRGHKHVSGGERVRRGGGSVCFAVGTSRK